MPANTSTVIAPPDILRAGALELVVTDLQASRDFYHGVLGLLITYEDAEEIHLRAFEEYLHHSLVLRFGCRQSLVVIGVPLVRACRGSGKSQQQDEAGKQSRLHGVSLRRRRDAAIRNGAFSCSSVIRPV